MTSFLGSGRLKPLSREGWLTPRFRPSESGEAFSPGTIPAYFGFYYTDMDLILKLLGVGVFLLIGTAAMVSAEPPPVIPVDSVDLERYAGKWYEIARYPNRFERKCACDVTAEYSLLPDGKIQVINRCRKADSSYAEAKGIARRQDKGGPNSKLEVRFAPSWLGWLGAVWGKYWIIDLAPDYSYAVVSEPSRKYLWILSRTPQMDPTVRSSIDDKLEAMGFDTDKLIDVCQD